MVSHTFAICAYKESPYLEECVLSLLGQSVKSRILIVTSTPNNHIKGLADKYGIPCYVNPGEGGITQDWNFGYACAKTDYVTIAHQDDVYEREYLRIALRALRRAEHPLIFFSDYFEIRNGRRIVKNRLMAIKRIMLCPLRFKPLQGSKWVRRRILSMGNPICCPSVTFAVKNLPQVVFQNGFRCCEDWEAWELLSRLEGQFVYAPRRLMGHRIHEDSETSAGIGDQVRTDEEYQMYCKFWPQWMAKLLIVPYAKGQKSNRLS